MDFLEKTISRHRSAGILVDSNLLLLLFAGLCDRSLVTRMKRLNAYSLEDFDLLVSFCELFERRVATPHILTEVSNLSEKGKEPVLRMFFEFLSRHLAELNERYEESALLAKHALFVSFGLADAGICKASEDGILVLTDDLGLYAALERRGAPAVNFNHLRMRLL
jgi:hypothetical protein